MEYFLMIIDYQQKKCLTSNFQIFFNYIYIFDELTNNLFNYSTILVSLHKSNFFFN